MYVCVSPAIRIFVGRVLYLYDQLASMNFANEAGRTIGIGLLQASSHLIPIRIIFSICISLASLFLSISRVIKRAPRYIVNSLLY